MEQLETLKPGRAFWDLAQHSDGFGGVTWPNGVTVLPITYLVPKGYKVLRVADPESNSFIDVTVSPKGRVWKVTWNDGEIPEGGDPDETWSFTRQ